MPSSSGSASEGGEGGTVGEFRDLVTFTREGTLQWGEQLLGQGTRTTVDRSHANTNFRLSVTRAGRREAGTYQCSALLWRRNYDNTWSKVANRTSNLLGISVLQPVSKLRVQKTNQSLVYLEDSRVRVNCSVASQTSQDSQHAVLWYRLSPRLYALTLNRAESSDSGTYYCLVEEWLTDPDGAWYRLARDSSGFTQVLVRQPERRDTGTNWHGTPHSAFTHRNLPKRNSKSPVSLSVSVVVSSCCSRPMPGAGQGAKALVCYFSRKVDTSSPHIAETHLFPSSARPCACLQFECYFIPPSLFLHPFFPPSPLSPNLPLSISLPSLSLALSAEVRLQVEESESNITVSQSGSIRLGCSIPSQSSRDSRFSVSWYVERPEEEDEEEEDQLCVFSIGHDAVFGNGNCSPTEEAGPNSRLQFERTTSDLYSLTIQGARPADTGRYYCHVEEWLLNPRNAWYRLATNNSGVTIVTVIQQVSTLQSVVCSNDSLFYFIFFYPFPIFGILLIAVLLVRYKSRSHSKSQEGKNGAPLLWIKEPHLSYSPTCLDPPALSLHPGSVE
ncbi:unnamed protein product [Oncorhynchus mykiss]|uniref:Ig-like domain-containing protein n=1 Tax=Oncorhynchus mykiss TaxID=8022 RepID=A0A060W7U1_ONCMY|nr:unnamed protein product [Oncorhynchus mykiss]